MKFQAKIWQKLSLFLSVVVLVVASFAVSASPAAAETYTIKMGADNGMLQFVPSSVTVKPGDSVDFQINSVPPHNAVFDKVPGGDAGLAKSLSKDQLMFSKGDTATVSFPSDAPKGEYTYYCQPHRGAGMSGTITVK